MNELFYNFSLIGVGSLFGIIIKHFLDKDIEKKFFKLALNKEEFFKMQERLEVIFNGLNFYNSTINIIKRSINEGDHFEKDFTHDEINKRMGENYQKSHELIFLYFNNFYDDFGELIDIYIDIINFYFKTILSAPRSGINLNYTNDNIIELGNKLNIYNKKQLLLYDNLKNEINIKRDLLLK